MKDLGCEDFVKERRGWGEFSDLVGVDHPYRIILRQYRHRGGSVVFLGQWWTGGGWRAALDRGPQKSTMAHIPFLREDFALMVGKGRGVVFPYLVAKELTGLRLSSPGVKE